MKADWKVSEDEFIHLPGTVVEPHRKGLTKWGKGRLFPVAVSARYNGGISFEDPNGVWHWARGFKVGKPVLPVGWELRSIHCSASLNDFPPVQEMLLVRVGTKHPKYWPATEEEAQPLK